MNSKVLSQEEQTKIALGMLSVLSQPISYDKKLEIIGAVLYLLDEALRAAGKHAK